MKDTLFSNHKLGGYFNKLKPLLVLFIFYLKNFDIFVLAFSTIKCERVNMSIFVGIFHLVYSCPLQSKLKQLN